MTAKACLAPKSLEAPLNLASFRGVHQDETILVCGCGGSLNELMDPSGTITIGVNDIGRRFHPNYLVVVNPAAQFAPERLAHIRGTQAPFVFTQYADLPVPQDRTVRFTLGAYNGTDFSRSDVLHYTQNSPYVAMCLAVHMGAKRIGLIGVDFTDNHFFAKTGRHPLASRLAQIDREYRKLAEACRTLGVEVFNLSPASRLTALPRSSLAEFMARVERELGQGSAANMHPRQRRIFVVNYRFLSCGDVFGDGLRHAARDLDHAYEAALWDDPELPTKIERFGPDLILVVHGRKFAERWRSTFSAYNTAVWLLDEPYEVDDTTKWSHGFNTVFINDPTTLPRHRNVHYLPVCYDPQTHHDNGVQRIYKVGFIGGYNAVRERYLLTLAEAGLLGYVVGGPWRAPVLRKLCPAANVPAERTADLYRQTEIVLNVFRDMHHFNRQGVTAFSMNPRIYEALACGAAVVSERRTEVDQVFPDLPQFDGPDELLAAVARLLADQTHLERTRMQCRDRLAGHSYNDRLKRVLQIVLEPEVEPRARKPILPGPIVEDWEDYGSIAQLAEEGILTFSKPRDERSGTETGLASHAPFTDVELSFDMRLSMDAWFVAKIHQQEQYDQTTNSYHIVLAPQHNYVAKHFTIFRSLSVKRGVWQRIMLRWVNQTLEVAVDGVLQARQNDHHLPSGYCFLGIKGGLAELREIRLQDLTSASSLSAAQITPVTSQHPIGGGRFPFAAPPRRNLIYHIWPVRGSTWKWNLDQLKQRIDLFNGRRVVGIAHDSRSESPETVQEYLEGHGCEFFIIANDQTGEVTTFPAMLERVVSQNGNELTFYGHAKGVKYEPDFPINVRRWAEVQYRVTLDDWATVKEHMQRFTMTGPFRIPGRFGAHHYVSDWHYCGTFFWMRHADVFSRRSRDVPNFYGGGGGLAGATLQPARNRVLVHG